MKKSWMLLTGLAAAVSCSQAVYQVEGTYTAADGTDVYLIDLQAKDTLGVTQVKDNAFSFTGKVAEPVYVYVGRGKERVRFILEPGTVRVDIDEREESGTPLLDTYNAFHHRFYSMDRLRNAERKELELKKGEMSPRAFGEAWDAINAKYASRQADVCDSLIEACPSDLVDALVLGDLALKDTARFMRQYHASSDKVKSFYQVQEAYDDIMLLSRTAPGKMFVDYLVKGGNPDGSDVRLSDYIGKGKYILVDHWASWCGPCKAEMPYIRKAYEAFKGDRFDVLGIAVSDQREDTQRALAELDLPWNQILDARSLPREHYGIATIPHLILFGPDGTILMRGLRGEQIYAVLEDLL